MKLMIVDSSGLFRDGVASLLKDETGVDIVGLAATGSEAAEMALKFHPDIILMDNHLSDGSGLAAMRDILSRQPAISFVIFTATESEELLLEAIRYGAKGILSKSITKPTLLYCLQALGRGEAIVSRKMMARVLDEISRMNDAANKNGKDISALTYRELEVLKRLENMATNREIASALIISENTVRVHVHNILDKLNLRNRREAAEFARRLR